MKNSMRRVSVTLSPEMDAAVMAYRKTDQFCRLSTSEIIRRLLDAGIRAGLPDTQPAKRPPA